MTVPILRIRADGAHIWELPNGAYHREDGPAVIWNDGSKRWYVNGKRHREDGPAKEFADGCKEWFLDGEQFYFDEYCSELKHNYGKSDEDIMLLRMQYSI